MWRLFSLLALVGCPDPAKDTPATAPPDDTDVPPVDTGPFVPTLPPTPPPDDPCDAFALVAPPDAGPQATVFLSVDGGLGPWTFAIDDNVSGGAINLGSGEWFTGEVSGVDTVSATDEGCALTDSAQVMIFEAVQALPKTALVPPTQAFSMGMAGGSGTWTCDAIDLQAGASLSGCDFVAGGEGINELTVTDSQTGQSDTSTITVSNGVVLLAESLILLPVGYPLVPVTSGGSGAFDLSAPVAGLQVVGGALEATAAGTSEVTATDPLTGLSQPVTVVASDPLTLDATTVPRDGDQFDLSHIRVADLDGDGFDEVVLSTLDRSVATRQGGAVYVFQGTATGPIAPPVFSAGSNQPDARAGRGIDLGDFDGDGELDLAVGEYTWDRGASASVGRVVIYRGLPGATFDPDDPWIVEGVGGSDQLGISVAACDVDGDGLDDLIAGGTGLDDDSVSPTVSASGGVQLHFGSVDGPSTFPDREWFGQRLGRDARLAEAGSSIATGDLDGDGLCDVAIGGRFGDAVTDGASRGGVWLLRDEDLLGAPGPAWKILGEPDDADAVTMELGFSVALISHPASTHDALLVGARLATTTAGDTRAGAVYGFRSQTLAAASDIDVIDATGEAEWTVEAPSANDYLGSAIVEAPGGLIRIGAPRIAASTGGGERGGVYTAIPVFDGTVVDSATLPVIEAEATGGFFGQAIGVTADGFVVAWSSRASHPDRVPQGLQDGALWLLDGLAPALPYPELELGGEATGQRIGHRTTWFDIDGGGEDLLVGVPGLGVAPTGYDTGAIAMASGGTGPLTFLDPIPERDRDEQLGTDLRNVGDLDGDGLDDLAAVGRYRTYTGPLPAPYATGTCPTDNRSRTGAVYIWLGAGGVSGDPDFVVFGTASSNALQSVSEAFDFDGDGQSGLAVGSSAASTVWVYDGPWTPTPGSIVERCDPESTITGPSGGFGTQVAAVPSLNGDGCDELAVVASGDDIAGPNRGALRVFRGCATGAAWMTWTGAANNHQLGSGGLVVGDLTQDGSPDIAVGSFSYDPPGNPDGGAVWVLNETDLTGLTFPNSRADTNLSGLASEVAVVPPFVQEGASANAQFGRALAKVGTGASTRLVVGVPGAHDGAGAAEGWIINAGGFATRDFVVGGEGLYAGMGRVLGTSGNNLAVTALDSAEGGVASGAVYVFTLP